MVSNVTHRWKVRSKQFPPVASVSADSPTIQPLQIMIPLNIYAINNTCLFSAKLENPVSTETEALLSLPPGGLFRNFYYQQLLLQY
jgi:hypothetical protein